MIGIDTNILIYASMGEEPLARHEAAIELLVRLAGCEAIVPWQVLGEYLAVCRRKKIVSLPAAQLRVNAWHSAFTTPSTQPADFLSAVGLCERFDLQYFDAVIASVTRRAGATHLLSEDMQDGLVIDGLTIINPFSAANAPLLASVLSS